MKIFIFTIAASLASVAFSAPTPQWGISTPFGSASTGPAGSSLSGPLGSASTGPSGSTLSGPFGSITLSPNQPGYNSGPPPRGSEGPRGPWRSNGWYTNGAVQAEAPEEASETAEFNSESSEE